MDTDVDLVVIGLGIGGEGVAGTLAERGLSVVGVETSLVGGECPYWGCIPSKMAIRAAHALEEARRVEHLAGRASVMPDWSLVAARIRDEATDDWDDQVAVDRFVGKGGHFVRGHARLDGPGRVVVGDDVFAARRGVVIASGTRPAVPPIPGLDSTPFWTNHDALEAKELPISVVVLGGGAIGLELAQTMRRFGTDVTIIEALDRLAPNEEPEAGAIIAEVLAAEGVDVRVGVRAEAVDGTDGEVRVHLSDESTVSAERLLVAVGRTANVDDVGLDTVGVDPEARFLETDAYGRVVRDGSPVEGLWGVGDVIGRGLFTHVAAYQAPVVVASVLGEETHSFDASPLSRVTFTDPEIGSVGLTEDGAREAGIDVATATQEVPSSARGWMHKVGNEGIIKLVVDQQAGTLVGATSVGPAGGEVLGLLSLAVHADVPIETMRTMIYAYPTFHRAIEDALANLS